MKKRILCVIASSIVLLGCQEREIKYLYKYATPLEQQLVTASNINYTDILNRVAVSRISSSRSAGKLWDATKFKIPKGVPPFCDIIDSIEVKENLAERFKGMAEPFSISEAYEQLKGKSLRQACDEYSSSVKN